MAGYWRHLSGRQKLVAAMSFVFICLSIVADSILTALWFPEQPPWWISLGVMVAGSAALVVLLIMTFRVKRRVDRRSAGLCPACGYDLRATPGRCPECGHGVHPAEGSPP